MIWAMATCLAMAQRGWKRQTLTDWLNTVCVLLMRMRWHQLVRLRATRCLRANIASVDQELTLLRVMPA